MLVRAPSISHTKKLENRIAELEAELSRIRGQESSSSAHPKPAASNATTQVSAKLLGEATANLPSLTRQDHGHISFHGRTSFMNLGVAGPAEQQDAHMPQDPEQEKQELINSAWTERAMEKFSTLPEAIQLLLDLHWCWVQPVFNFVYRPTFTRDLQNNGPYCSVLLLNAVLAHSVRWAKADIRMVRLLEPFEGGAYFGRQARASLMEAVQSGAPSIPTVQALLLLSAQECGQGNLSQAWLYSGMAFRLIVDLGIVFDGRRYARTVRLSVEDIEIRSRLFWSCYFWDKLISLYLGRLPIIQETSVSPSLQVLDDTGEIDTWIPQGLDQTQHYPPAQAHTTSCFINTCALSKILNAVLVTMYNPVKEGTLSEVAKCALEEEQKLGKWHENLPAHLTISVHSLPEQCPPSHIITLKILLHRPLLTTYGKQDDADDPQNSHHLRQCLEAANSTLVIFNFFTRSFGDGHVITSQAYTVYIAASVFLLQVQATKDFASQAMENLRYCVDALERIKMTSQVIGSALTLIYRELQRLDANLIVRSLDGSYHMSGGSASTTTAWHQQNPDAKPNGLAQRIASGWVSGGGGGGGPPHESSVAAFAIPDFNVNGDFDIPSDFFSMLPELEPISANVGAGFEIDLDKPWY
ncbi:hypothetical protein MBLNU13_g06585t2 [Cladosporium sp. NU13]